MTDKPNILLIYADQMRYDAMRCAGNPVIKTPQIDRLAREGVQFTEAYTSFPICCPFRASVMTGKYAQNHGLIQNHFPLRSDQTFLGDLMKQAGYRTGYIGKWHLEGGPKPGFVPPGRRFGWDHFIGFNRGHDYMVVDLLRRCGAGLSLETLRARLPDRPADRFHRRRLDRRGRQALDRLCQLWPAAFPDGYARLPA